MNRLGYFKIEIYKAFSPVYFENSQKLHCITSVMNLIKLLTAESQSNQKIYNLIYEFYKIISLENWLKEYIFWELKLLKTLGYDLELDTLVNKTIIDNKTQYIVKSLNEERVVPNFLIDKEDSLEDKQALLNGLKLVSDFMEKTILKPNNLNYPLSRIQFVSSLK